jgi:serine/threonine protein kinase
MSPSYLAPEQFRPEENQNVGYKSDIWGLGGIIIRMLSGGAPFAGMENDAIEQHVCDDRKLPPIDFASIHPGLAKIIESCFQYDPGMTLHPCARKCMHMRRHCVGTYDRWCMGVLA